MIKKILKNSERGQAIILIALAVVGLVAMVGLMTDGGILLIEYARLKRGIDAASIAAAQQFRRDFTGSELVTAAENFLKLNQSDVVTVEISMCDPPILPGYPNGKYNGVPAHDASLCPAAGEPLRKLIRVTASREVTFGFMRVVGFDHKTITATSVGEAASIDLVMIMDTSLSMAYGTSGSALELNPPGDDPAACNANDTCQPLLNVKTVARAFIQTLFFPYDRVAIVTMTGQPPDTSRNPVLYPFEHDPAVVDATLANIKVYQPPVCVRDETIPGKWVSPSKGICLEYDSSGTFIGQNRPIWLGGADLDPNTLGDGERNPTSLGSSNVGGAFYNANNAFLGGTAREDAFWVVIALISGPANATSTSDLVNFPDGYCPSNTWNANTTTDTPNCRDNDLLTPFLDTPLITRHSRGNPNAIPVIPPDPDYDADDYARDAADDLADPVTGNGIVIFTIGLGTTLGEDNPLKNSTIGLPESGENLLIYAAEQAGDHTDVNGFVTAANHGKYYYAEDPTLDLGPIFLAIASNIFTRISQ